MPTISNTELIVNDIITRLKTITTAGGYRNDVAFVGKVSTSALTKVEYPQLFVYALDGKVGAEDGASTVYKESTKFAIEGYVKTELDTQEAGNLSDAMESFIHDVLKCLSTLPIMFINTHSWFIAIHSEGIQIDRSIDAKQMMGGFQIRFTCVSYRTDDFDATIS